MNEIWNHLQIMIINGGLFNNGTGTCKVYSFAHNLHTGFVFFFVSCTLQMYINTNLFVCVWCCPFALLTLTFLVIHCKLCTDIFLYLSLNSYKFTSHKNQPLVQCYCKRSHLQTYCCLLFCLYSQKIKCQLHSVLITLAIKGTMPSLSTLNKIIHE